MNKVKRWVTGTISAVLLGISSHATAITVYDGTVTGPDGSWGFLNFSHSGGALIIDAWADGYTAGLTGDGIYDIYLSLFVNDGSARSAFTGAHLISNDEYSLTQAGLLDGSTSTLDSLIDLASLAAGKYMLAISLSPISGGADFKDIRNETVLVSGIERDERDYRLTFSQDVTIPEPAILALVGLGLAGISYRRHRVRSPRK